jgi:hypothetical protein
VGQEWGRGKVAVVEVERPTPVDRVAETGVRVAAVVGRGQVQAGGKGKPFGMWMVVVAVDLMAGMTVAGVAGVAGVARVPGTLETWGVDLGQSRGGVLARVLGDTRTEADGQAAAPLLRTKSKFCRVMTTWLRQRGPKLAKLTNEFAGGYHAYTHFRRSCFLISPFFRDLL